MTTSPDPDALDAIVSQHGNRWYNRGCLIGRAVADLPRDAFRERLVAYMNRPVSEVSHAALMEAVAETLGLEWRSDALGRHRRHLCRCSAEVYE